MTITLAELQTRSATDRLFRENLIADPAQVLAEHGVEVPDGITVEVHPSTTQTLVLTLPPFLGHDGDIELDDAALGRVDGGNQWVPSGFFGNLIGGLGPVIGAPIGGLVGQIPGGIAGHLGSFLPFSPVPPGGIGPR
ncbi:hypothetical protein GIS00_23175 [Nakamurella sp. YIM 132087]|uniref:NHLP leader peptide family natural product n=1 Tax=Nakamurella alba TaxID=2665158 RepID=A0A7K1FRZ2_9ACTN|nr:hypothetical protein [Nakamurella alba]MTD16840.1 hypothetical protein [Nakamurella alba]